MEEGEVSNQIQCPCKRIIESKGPFGATPTDWCVCQKRINRKSFSQSLAYYATQLGANILASPCVAASLPSQMPVRMSVCQCYSAKAGPCPYPCYSLLFLSLSRFLSLWMPTFHEAFLHLLFLTAAAAPALSRAGCHAVSQLLGGGTLWESGTHAWNFAFWTALISRHFRYVYALYARVKLPRK